MASNFWNFRGQSPVNTEEAERAAYVARQKANMQGYTQPGMGGYVPSQEAPGMAPGVVTQNTPPFSPNQMGGVRLPQEAQGGLGQGWNYTRQQEQEQALKDEYQRNAARIAEIENELADLTKSERGRLDDLDMRLAENRSEIGDIGNAQMHLGRIEARRNSDSDRALNDAKNRMAAEDEIDRLYMMRAEGSPGQQAYYDRAIARKEADYQSRYGKPYGGSLQIPTGSLGAGDRPANMVAFNQKMQSLRNDKGNLTEAAIAELERDIEGLPQGEARNAAQKALAAEKSQEKKDRDAGAEREKNRAAADAAKKEDTYSWKWPVGKSETRTVNGRSVTVTKVSSSVTRYECGKYSTEG